MLTLTTVLGILGAVIVLLAFTMNQIKKWEPDSLIYDLTNAIGGILLIIYAFSINSLPFVIINIAWAGFSIWGLVNRL